MEYRKIEIKVPRLSLPKPSRRWLPSPGNVIFTLCMIGLLLWAQTAGALPLPSYLNAPDAPSTGTIAYQGRLADVAGNPLTSTINMEFRLYSGATGGVPIWEEFWTGPNAVQVSDGLFNVMLGSLDPIPQSLVTGNNSLWLGITVDNDDEMLPRVQLGSVPFAVQALTVPDGSVTSAKIADGTVTSRKFRPTTGDAGLTPCCVSLTGAPQDIPGTERTISVETPSVVFVNATFDFVLPVEGATAVGNVTLNGVRVGRQAVASGYGYRVTAGTTIRLDLTPGTHRLGLSASSDGAAPALVYHHTGYTFLLASR